jgi:hypothetical protein
MNRELHHGAKNLDRILLAILLIIVGLHCWFCAILLRLPISYLNSMMPKNEIYSHYVRDMEYMQNTGLVFEEVCGEQLQQAKFNDDLLSRQRFDTQQRFAVQQRIVIRRLFAFTATGYSPMSEGGKWHKAMTSPEDSEFLTTGLPSHSRFICFERGGNQNGDHEPTSRPAVNALSRVIDGKTTRHSGNKVL